jgi:hypothetical protein
MNSMLILSVNSVPGNRSSGVVAVFLVLVSIFATAQIGAKVQQTGSVHGIWQNSQFGYQMMLLLNADGSGEFDGEPIVYVTKGHELSITMGTTETIYQYTLSGNSLTLSGGDLDGKVTFTHEGTGKAENPARTSPPASQSYSNTSSNLIGLWSGNGELIEFRTDGKCVYLGNTFPYKVSQGYVILSTAQGPVSFEYTVNGAQLTLIANGQKVVYYKPAGAGTSQPQASTGKGHVAMELTGEWCYMNMNTNSQSSRCITLRADGTYYYTEGSSRSVNTDAFSGGTASQGEDRGTWYVEGDRIYYHSQTNGDGSYRLEKRNHPKNVNDPMIVLDGVSYVTTTQRSPWR